MFSEVKGGGTLLLSILPSNNEYAWLAYDTLGTWATFLPQDMSFAKFIKGANTVASKARGGGGPGIPAYCSFLRPSLLLSPQTHLGNLQADSASSIPKYCSADFLPVWQPGVGVAVRRTP